MVIKLKVKLGKPCDCSFIDLKMCVQCLPCTERVFRALGYIIEHKSTSTLSCENSPQDTDRFSAVLRDSYQFFIPRKRQINGGGDEGWWLTCSPTSFSRLALRSGSAASWPVPTCSSPLEILRPHVCSQPLEREKSTSLESDLHSLTWEPCATFHLTLKLRCTVRHTGFGGLSIKCRISPKCINCLSK